MLCSPPFLLSSTCLTSLLLSNHVPWAIIVACEGAFAILFIVIRTYLAMENKRRDLESSSSETYDDVYITVKGEDGSDVQKKVDKAFLDLTDRQNRDFRYVL